METVTVNLGPRSSPIRIGSGCLQNLGQLLREARLGQGHVVVVTDHVVAEHYRDAVVEALHGAGWTPRVIEVPAGEAHKNLAWLAFVYDKLVEGRHERGTPLIALGGGVVGDLAGFAAATFQRGVPFVQVPTTLLAQVDASVGGKTAINHAAGKNLIGAFYQPRLVVIDVDTLSSLPRREFVAGVAEVIKYGIVLSPELFVRLETRLDGLLRRDPAQLISTVKTCCQLKALVVQQDETEGDYRAILNFGHTLGHALEGATGYTRYLHGEAVAIGMVFAGELSFRRGLCTETTSRRIRELVEQAGLPVTIPDDLRGQHLVVGLETDKKMAGGKVKFVCVEAIGKTRFEFLDTREIASYL